MPLLLPVHPVAVNYYRPISLYLVVPPSDKIRLRPLIRLMFTMVVNRLTEKMVFEQKRNKHQLLLLIDEFPSLNRMEIFADALSYIDRQSFQICDSHPPNTRSGAVNFGRLTERCSTLS